MSKSASPSPTTPTSNNSPEIPFARSQRDSPEYRAHYILDDNGSWFVKVADLPGAHSHGRTIVAARKNLREAVALVLDNDDETSSDLAETFDIPNREQLDTVLALRNSAQCIANDADQATRDYHRKVRRHTQKSRTNAARPARGNSVHPLVMITLMTGHKPLPSSPLMKKLALISSQGLY
jgi:predicted RNase H-like HicB family nuclease